jgi:hypothetical protein
VPSRFLLVNLPTHFIAQSVPACSKLLPPMLLNRAKLVPNVQPSSSMGVNTTSTMSKVVSVLVAVLVTVATILGEVSVAVLVIVLTGYLCISTACASGVNKMNLQLLL